VRVLVTGGAGYIGSHTGLALIERGHVPLILDNLSNASAAVVDRLRELGGVDIRFFHADIRDGAALDRVFAAAQPEAVLHFAALKAVGDSCARPLEYFDNNITGSIELLRAMRRHGVGRIVFSSSATVYGQPKRLPVTEDEELSAANPYGRTKIVVEQLIDDLVRLQPGFLAANLRYFNPVGAHPSGRLGEAPLGEPLNLMPIVTRVASGQQDFVRVFGNDYPTRDGTAIRDYLHVVDLAHAHVVALDYLVAQGKSVTVNLGTGRGHSVMEVIQAFERACGLRVPFRVVARRPGDVAQVWADPSRAEALLGWKAQLSLERMCEDAWRWAVANPRGYE
jgi:UDP-glucose 4-epimerase